MDEEKMLQWKQIIETCEESGMPIKCWCKENQISAPSYYYWKKRIFPANEVPTNDTTFVEVPFASMQEEKPPVISLDVKWNAIIITLKGSAKKMLINLENWKTKCYF